MLSSCFRTHRRRIIFFSCQNMALLQIPVSVPSLCVVLVPIVLCGALLNTIVASGLTKAKASRQHTGFVLGLNMGECNAKHGCVDICVFHVVLFCFPFDPVSWMWLRMLIIFQHTRCTAVNSAVRLIGPLVGTRLLDTFGYNSVALFGFSCTATLLLVLKVLL